MKKSSDAYTVLFEDPNVLVVNKKIGIAVQSKDKENALETIIAEEKNTPIFAISRIDQPVSGIVLFAKTKESATDLSGQIARKKITKTYHAIVEGDMPESGVLEHKLSKSKNNKAIEDSEGQDARLTFKTIKKLDRYTIVSIKTSSGRFHQIRAQLSLNGNPIKGDLKYGAKRSNEGGGIYLHCQHMRCLHPISGKQIEVEAPYPEMKLWSLV